MARTGILGMAVVALLPAGCVSEKQYEKTQEQ